MNSAIKVENLSKAYQLGQLGTGTISRDLSRWYAKIRGKEDPFLKIGESNIQNIKSESDVVWSLREINFEIEQGDAVGIIGRNGAGKSTLLKILSKVTAPTTGKIFGNGRIASLLEVGTGFHPELSGRENIFLNGAILGMRKKEIQRKLEEIVDFAGIERYLDTPVKRYSSGMYVRLAFAVAAHLESEILIVDEVLAVGDAEFQKKCLGKMGEVSKRDGRTILFVSHNMNAISNFCSKAHLLVNGTLAYSGDVIKTIEQYTKAKNQIERTQISNYKLNDLVEIDNFSLSGSGFISFSDLRFDLTISSALKNIYHTIAILLYDELGQKVAFIDLRNEKLLKIYNSTFKISVSGTILNLPLLPGRYNLGIHVNSALLYKDFFDLIQFVVHQKAMADDITPYPVHIRGNIELDYKFEYY
ncbi:ABC transporter ATP-binding protein [Pedobacter sp. Leaf176]|uniref:ABC transporter ATP-binding protein n=1 Tax=Pedobacter sp. Leaf176 TaxID=1736286 RepID=UPI0006FB15BC|nr:ABC transporter ATP-binding protein [Pedobacter sp. Leaf176]KQR72696.1 hypothetical protein ASF92_05325 [Pedobacter sp. Leaf176]